MTISKTFKKFLYYKKIKVPTYGYILSLIDYGEVLNNKYKHDEKNFRKHPKEYIMRNDIFYPIVDMIGNSNKYVLNCKKQGKKLPWEKERDVYKKFFIKILNNYPIFWDRTTKKYIKLYPQIKIYYDYFEKNKTFEKNQDLSYGLAFAMIYYEFGLNYPKKFSEYYGWCSYHYFRLPKNEVQDILKAKNLDYLVRYSLKKLQIA